MERLVGLIILSLLSLVPALIAHRKGRGFLGWWLFGYMFLLLALPVALLVPRNRARIAEPGFRKWPSPRLLALTAALAMSLNVGLLSLREFVFEAHFLPSESMLPTLAVGDRVIVDKVSYRFGAPRRGDLVVFLPPERAGGVGNSHIKRIVALPGETIAVKGGRLYVNGQALSESYVLEPIHYAEPDWSAIGLTAGKVPGDSYFVLGDNRNNSMDSHVFGTVPRDHLIGRASYRFWPSDRMGAL